MLKKEKFMEIEVTCTTCGQTITPKGLRPPEIRFALITRICKDCIYFMFSISELYDNQRLGLKIAESYQKVLPKYQKEEKDNRYIV